MDEHLLRTAIVQLDDIDQNILNMDGLNEHEESLLSRASDRLAEAKELILRALGDIR
jgi:hypothetical protein